MKLFKGFTIVEIAVVILVIAFLAAAVTPMLFGSSQKAIIAEAQASLGVLNNCVELYMLEFGKYPKDAVEFAQSDYYDSEDFKCTYVDDSCFDYRQSGSGYLLICSSNNAGDKNNVMGTYHAAPKIQAFKKLNVEITLNEKGEFTVTYFN